MALRPRGFILSGGPSSVYDPGAPLVPQYVFDSSLPVLGICYGMQALAYQLGGAVAPHVAREYGPATVSVEDAANPLFSDLSASLAVWVSHGDRLERVPDGFR